MDDDVDGNNILLLIIVRINHRARRFSIIETSYSFSAPHSSQIVFSYLAESGNFRLQFLPRDTGAASGLEPATFAS